MSTLFLLARRATSIIWKQKMGPSLPGRHADLPLFHAIKMKDYT